MGVSLQHPPLNFFLSTRMNITTFTINLTLFTKHKRTPKIIQGHHPLSRFKPIKPSEAQKQKGEGEKKKARTPIAYFG